LVIGEADASYICLENNLLQHRKVGLQLLFKDRMAQVCQLEQFFLFPVLHDLRKQWSGLRICTRKDCRKYANIPIA
jgi:hypothetical protein